MKTKNSIRHIEVESALSEFLGGLVLFMPLPGNLTEPSDSLGRSQGLASPVEPVHRNMMIGAGKWQDAK